MNRLIIWLEKASHNLAVFLITLAFVTGTIALSFTPNAGARSLISDLASHQTNDNTGSWTRSPLAKEKTLQAAPDTADNVHNTPNLNQPTKVRAKVAGPKGFFNMVKNRVDNAVSNAAENTKDAFGGIGEDVRDTIKDASEPIRD